MKAARKELTNKWRTLRPVKPEPISTVPEEPPLPKAPTIHAIRKAVCGMYGLTDAEMLAVRRQQRTVYPRQIAMYLAVKHTVHSYNAIGSHFGGRDHTTVMHSFQKINSRRKVDQELDGSIRKLCEELGV